MSKRILTLISILVWLFAFPTLNLGQEGNPKVLIKTTKGDITVELYADKAPLSVKNFLSYVDEKFYDGTIFHRVIKGFMIQAGGLSANLIEKPVKLPIKNEADNGLKNKKGTIAMGRTPEVHSATCHFYINHVDNPGLDYRNSTPDGFGYAVFGKVIKGMDVVDAIANAKTTIKYDAANNPWRDVPSETITIISIRQIQE